jgi:pseudaminic acid cytidylyltransferase
MNIAIIPARAGSKRIKNKNIKNFYKKPMIYWVIKKILNSNLFDLIVVSSDSQKILNLSKKYGVTTVIKRPKKLANDYADTSSVILHSIKYLIKNKISVKNICCIYPCNPFLKIVDLVKGYSLLKKNPKSLIFAVAKYSHPIQRALKMGKNNKITFINRSFKNRRTQDLKNYYYDAAQFYIGKIYAWKNYNTSSKIGVEIPEWRVADIDNYSDWKKAELLFKIIK